MEGNPKTKYNLSIESEREYWIKNVLNNWIKYDINVIIVKKIH